MRLACPEDPYVPLHLVQRALSACFSGARDCAAYLGILREQARNECALHAYALLGNHVHLLLTPSRKDGATRLMRRVKEDYARHIRQAHGYGGPLWEERFDGTPVRSRRYLFACMRYIEANPVRARMVRDAAAYRWSSYRGNALGDDDPLLTPHPFYYSLGRTRAERCVAYRALSEQEARITGIGLVSRDPA